MIKRKHANELAALRRLALEDVLQASEADLREQAEEEGLDFNELAEKIRSSMREAAASALRQRGRVILRGARLTPRYAAPDDKDDTK